MAVAHALSAFVLAPRRGDRPSNLTLPRSLRDSKFHRCPGRAPAAGGGIARHSARGANFPHPARRAAFHTTRNNAARLSWSTYGCIPLMKKIAAMAKAHYIMVVPHSGSLGPGAGSEQVCFQTRFRRQKTLRMLREKK